MRSQLSAAIARLAPLREELKAAIDADAESYNSVMKAYKAGKGAVVTRSGEALIDAALKQATAFRSASPKGRRKSQRSSKLEPITNPNMKSDLTTAVALAGAAQTGAFANVEINLTSLKDPTFKTEIGRRIAALS